ncbi:MAG TPA: hypothetical protein PKG66_07405, partial [Methanothrix sp.]|nr:hypothetical protein [Methanothrix sp.]
ILALALAACLCMAAMVQAVEPQVSEDYLSGSQIRDEVGWGEYTDVNDSSLSFRNESLFIIRKDTGMSPNVPEMGVRSPAIVGRAGVAMAAGSWALTLNDLDKRYLKLELYQSGDAVFGSGELAQGAVVTPVTAGGSILGNQLALFVISAGSQNMYRLSLTIQAGSMNGDYIFTAPGVNQPGVAFGSLIAPQSPQAAQQTAPAIQASPAVPTQPAALPGAFPAA